MLKTFGPLSIVVENGHWGAFGDATSWKNRFAMKLLENAGGISDTVEDGWYQFTVERRGWTLYTNLQKVA